MIDGLIDSVMVGVQFLVEGNDIGKRFAAGFANGYAAHSKDAVFAGGFMAGLAKGVFFGATAFLVNLFCKNMNFIRVVLLFLLFILWQWSALNFMLFQANPKLFPGLLIANIFAFFWFWSIFGGSKKLN